MASNLWVLNRRNEIRNEDRRTEKDEHVFLYCICVELRLVPEDNSMVKLTHSWRNLRMNTFAHRLASWIDRKGNKKKLTHNEPVLKSAPLLILPLRRISELAPKSLHRRLTPNVHDRLNFTPLVQPLHKIINGLILPSFVFASVLSKGGDEVGVGIYDAGVCSIYGKQKMGFVRDGLLFVFAHWWSIAIRGCCVETGVVDGEWWSEWSQHISLLCKLVGQNRSTEVGSTTLLLPIAMTDSRVYVADEESTMSKITTPHLPSQTTS